MTNFFSSNRKKHKYSFQKVKNDFNDFKGRMALPLLLTATFLLSGFSVFSAYRECYGFERVFFTQRFFLPWTLPLSFGTFCDSYGVRNTSSKIILCTCSHRDFPSSWLVVLNYSYCRYKTIGLSIALVSRTL